MSNQSVSGLPQVIHKVGYSSSHAHCEHMLNVLERPWNVKSISQWVVTSDPQSGVLLQPCPLWTHAKCSGTSLKCQISQSVGCHKWSTKWGTPPASYEHKVDILEHLCNTCVRHVTNKPLEMLSTCRIWVPCSVFFPTLIPQLNSSTFSFFTFNCCLLFCHLKKRGLPWKFTDHVILN